MGSSLFTAGDLHADLSGDEGQYVPSIARPYMNQLHVGFKRTIKLPKGSFLFIDDEVPKHPKAKVFDPLHHSFIPLKNIDKKTARDLAHVLYTVSPQGENTLTVRNGRRALAQAFIDAKRLDQLTVQSA